ncbi:MAG: hypothetical protein A2571_02470 [Candidatus Vogelbacteria bacterium RIFOXYD1_FULL_44_32]|uniref:Uncharacterized protein n=1 Tax=Candidatus Vogelbacteria bacterium RIFOXYD1_FULL_44_32 TaxID=1802438 RepID=A0A1G2QEV4_9BACT|nr:MAG: hypothetical protein A2571_02470 [Candidatus Vogelbacteria bacterium RIFOXYD1_FULL_44_32]
MFKDFLMRKMLKSQGVPEAQIDQALLMINKNPDLFKKIADEIQIKTSAGGDKMAVTMEVMKKYESELKAIK